MTGGVMREKPSTERDGKICALVSYTDSTGKRRQIWRKAESKSDAREIARNLKDQLRNGTEQFEHTLTVSEYLDKWFAHIKDKRAEKTIEGYELIIRLYIKPHLGRKQLSKLEPLDVQGMIDTLRYRTLSTETTSHKRVDRSHRPRGRAVPPAHVPCKKIHCTNPQKVPHCRTGRLKA
jgi:hypothetical protein